MSVYTIAGEEIFAVYDAEGAGLSQAYDIDTNPLLGDDAISGRIITFDSNGTLPKSLTLSLSPTQAGSGDPSSSNIRNQRDNYEDWEESVGRGRFDDCNAGAEMA